MSIEQIEQLAQAGTLAAEVREWLAENWKGTDDLDWRHAVVDARWAAPTWPQDSYGRGLSAKCASVIAEEFAAAGAPGACRDTGDFETNSWIQLGGRAIVAYGSPELKERFLRILLSGEMSAGCLLYSEPGAGSDLAGLQTRAEPAGDEFVVNGQKVWTTGGKEAEFGLLLARTDWDVPKHAGISFFIIPMQQDGIDIRPIKQMTGDAEFNEVFLTDARVPAANLVGQLNDGWRVLQTALAAERAGMGGMRASGGTGDDAAPTRSELFTAAHDLIQAARQAGQDEDSVARQEITKILTWRIVNDWNAARAAAELGNGNSSSLASLSKLAMSRILHSSAALRARLLGPKAMLYGTADPEAFEVNHDLLYAFINSIGGGSDQIQRNIISERVLGLPKGHEPDKGVPFRDVRKSATTPPLS